MSQRRTSSQPQPMPPPSPQRPRWFVRFVGASGIVAAVLTAWLIWGPSPPPDLPESPEKTFADPPFSTTRFRNTTAETRYVGSDACSKCHAGKHQSYLLTPHSRALAEVDPQTEPPDHGFVHQASRRHYRVYRRDGQMRHEEILRSTDGHEIARVDWPIRYRVGSGQFARTYLVEFDGFLHESPITWYAGKKQWHMSPGYDIAKHISFERPVAASCLACHAGRVESAEAVHRPIMREKAIGCESCHGPGSLHVAFHKTKQQRTEDDLTIVNPGKLSRPQLESICSACHLQSVARVLLRGRQIGDFRPGTPLGDYCVDYRLDTGSEQMTVVGHMEQLRRSACYQQSKEMTCLTCHDPHARALPGDSTAFYRQKCLSCHSVKTCKVAHAERIKKQPADNCAACHMPRGDTDIPHVAFTHHRIGVHTHKPASANKLIPTLVPIGDVANLSPLEHKRNLGLAYRKALQKPECAAFTAAFAGRARSLLDAVYEEGMREADVTGALADLYLPIDPVRSEKYARQTLTAKRLSPEVRADALILLAASELKQQHVQEAIRLLQELTLLRRASDDWGLLGMCHHLHNQPQDALAAFKQALSIRPDLQTIHLKVAEVYEALGDSAHAREYQQKARWLSQLRSE